jgi:hypothetical protein
MIWELSTIIIDQTNIVSLQETLNELLCHWSETETVRGPGE